jgi:peptidoglycan hydrolase-like protein with peptidoglycan-binding domain
MEPNGMKLIPRSSWEARPAKVRVPHIESTRGVKVHFTGDHVDPAITGDRDRCGPLVRAIQNFHMDSNGWNDIGYTALVCPHGWVFEGRGLNKLPAANGAGLNSAHYAVCGLVGNKGLTVPSDAMLNGIRDAIEWLRAKGDAGTEIKGHRDGYDTDCPGPKLYAWVKAGAPRPGQEPAFPLPSGHWFGMESANPRNHSGYWMKDRSHIVQIQTWLEAPLTGRFGLGLKVRVKAYQAKHELAVDGLVGPKTWESLAR